jgi:hypothetical protein
MTDHLAEALQSCLEAIDAGASVETALGRQPALADELRPLVLSVMAVRARRPRPSSAWRLRTEAEVLAIAARRPSVVRWALGVGAPGLAAAIALLVVAGLSVAAAASRPGDALYPLRASVVWLFTGTVPGDRAVDAGPSGSSRPNPTMALGAATIRDSLPEPGVGAATAVLRRAHDAPSAARSLPSATLRLPPQVALVVVARPTPFAAVFALAATQGAPAAATEPPAPSEPSAAAPPVLDTAVPSPAASTPTPEAPPLPLPITPEGGATMPVPPTASSADVGVLSGHISTADGGRVSGAFVTAYVRWGRSDLWWWIWQWDRTDHEGAYRLARLPAGHYKVVAWGGPDRHPYQWHPAALDPKDSEAIDLGQGETRSDVDVRFNGPVAARTATPTTPSPTAEPTGTPTTTPSTSTPVPPAP